MKKGIIEITSELERQGLHNEAEQINNIIVQHIDNYFQKLKQVFESNVDQMKDPEFVKSKL